MITIDYKMLLEHSFKTVRSCSECPPENRLAYLSEHIFSLTTYDSSMDELFAAKAVEVCEAINQGTTFEYIKEPEQYKWFLLMCNMPFFVDKLEWGTSIRGAWWGARPGRQIELDSCGIWIGDKQCTETLKFGNDDWRQFIAAVIEFAAPEMKPNARVERHAPETDCGSETDSVRVSAQTTC